MRIRIHRHANSSISDKEWRKYWRWGSYICSVVFDVNVFVRQWIPLLDIHAIDNTSDAGHSADIIQFYTFFYARDEFLCIVWTHCYNPVRF